MERRDFLRSAGAGAMLGLFPASLESVQRENSTEKLERRSLGRTGEKLSIIGFGGIVVMDATAAQASQRVGEAIDAGVNYFDVAPTYGNAEDMLGPALTPYRKSVFLACKTEERMREGASAALDRSLRKHHAVTKLEDVDKILGPDGAMEAFEAARKAGKVRFLGFSAHSVEAALALMDRADFDTILFPVNFGTWYAGAQEKKMGILALKALANGPLEKGKPKKHAKCWYEPLDQPGEAGMALRFTLSHPVTAAIPPGDENLFKMALGLAANFKPLTGEEVDAIKRKGTAASPIFKYPQA